MTLNYHIVTLMMRLGVFLVGLRGVLGVRKTFQQLLINFAEIPKNGLKKGFEIVAKTDENEAEL